MKRRWPRILGWTFAAFVLVLALDLIFHQAPFRFLGEFGFKRGPKDSHSMFDGSYVARADWASVVRSAREELAREGFVQTRLAPRVVLFMRGTGRDDPWVAIAKDVKYAYVSRSASRPLEPIAGPMPGWVAVYVSGIDQSPLLAKILSLLMGPW